MQTKLPALLVCKQSNQKYSEIFWSTLCFLKSKFLREVSDNGLTNISWKKEEKSDDWYDPPEKIWIKSVICLVSQPAILGKTNLSPTNKRLSWLKKPELLGCTIPQKEIRVIHDCWEIKLW